MASRNIRSELKFLNIVLLKDSLLGIGSYGSVFKAKCDDLVCAAKILHPTLVYWDTEQSDTRHEERLPMRRFEAECQFMKDIKHPHIIQYLGLYTDPETFLPVLLMELLDESLTHLLQNQNETISPMFQIIILSEVACALSYLHANGIVHRDLSSNNILLLAKCRAKLADFGMAKIVKYNMSNTISPGTQVYMPPESMDNATVFTEKGDVFSLGVIIVQILTRKFPKPKERFKTIEIDHPLIPAGNVEIRVSEVERRQDHISHIEVSNPLLPIALECLRDSADDRPSATELCERFLAIKIETQGNNMEDKKEEPSGINHSQEVVQTLHQETDSNEQRIRSLQQDLEAAKETIDQKDAVIAMFTKEQQQNQKLIFKYKKQIEALEKELKRAIARNSGPENRSKIESTEPQPPNIIQQTNIYLKTKGNERSISPHRSMLLSAEVKDVDYENFPSASKADKLSQNDKEQLQSEFNLEAETTPPILPLRNKTEPDSTTHLNADDLKKTAATHSGVKTQRENVTPKIESNSRQSHTNLPQNVKSKIHYENCPSAYNKIGDLRATDHPAVFPMAEVPIALHSGIETNTGLPSIKHEPQNTGLSNTKAQEINDYVNLPSADSDPELNTNTEEIHDYVNLPSANSDPELNTSPQEIHDYENLPLANAENGSKVNSSLHHSVSDNRPAVHPRIKTPKPLQSGIKTESGERITPQKSTYYDDLKTKPLKYNMTESSTSNEQVIQDSMDLPSFSHATNLNLLSKHSGATDVSKCPTLPPKITTQRVRADSNRSDDKIILTSLPDNLLIIKTPESKLDSKPHTSLVTDMHPTIPSTFGSENQKNEKDSMQASSSKFRHRFPHNTYVPGPSSNLKMQKDKSSINQPSDRQKPPLPPPITKTQAELQRRPLAMYKSSNSHSHTTPSLETEKHKIHSITDSPLPPPPVPPRRISRRVKPGGDNNTPTDFAHGVNPANVPLKTTSLTSLQQFYVHPPPQRRRKGELILTWQIGNNPPAVMSRDTDAVVNDRMLYVRPHRTRKIYSYNSLTSQWSQQPDCFTDNTTLAIIEGCLTTVGGTLSKKLLTLTLSDQEKTWREKYPSMNVERARCTAITIDSALVVAGGTTVTTMGPQALSSVEILNTDQKQWTLAAELPQSIYASSGTLANGSIYLLGGLDKFFHELKEVYCCSFVDLVSSCHSNNPLRKISALKPSRKHSTVWTTITNPPTTEATVVTIRNKLVTIGGRDEHDTPTNAVYMYDTGGNAWSRIGELNHARAMSFAAVIHNNVILTVGGVTAIKNVSIDSLEIAQVI